MKGIILLLMGLLAVLQTEVFSPATGRFTAPEPENVFDGAQIKEGDIVAGMKVIRSQTAAVDGEIFGAVQFEGEATISGTYIYVKNDEFLGEAVLFRVDESSWKKLPKMKSDPRDVWFVFDNFAEAKDMLEAEAGGGKAVIVIDRYFINYKGTEAYNTARLIKVIEKK